MHFTDLQFYAGISAIPEAIYRSASSFSLSAAGHWSAPTRTATTVVVEYSQHLAGVMRLALRWAHPHHLQE